MKLLVAFAVCFCTYCAPAQRSVASLDAGWTFHEGATPDAVQAKFDDSKWDAVSIPHSYPPGGTGDNRWFYRGEAWYRKSFTPLPAWKGRRVFLRFDAVMTISNTYLNGVKLGEHRGGFSAFTYEITDKLNFDGPNQISVQTDNRRNEDVAPIEDSITQYGGIYRHVTLIVTGPVGITTMDYSSPGVFLTQVEVKPDKAIVKVITEVDSALDAVRPLSVRLLLIDGAGKPVFKVSSDGEIAPKKTTSVAQTITIPNPHLWNGVADPYLYSVRIDLMDGTNVLDTVVQPLGLRAFQVDHKRGFVLNGVGRQIHGVCLHQDFGEGGWDVTRAQEQQDLTTLREMGVDGIRLVHYPHSQSALDLYDKAGMLIWSELPVFQQVGTSTAFRDNAREQLKEMIRQNYNHPSIFTWSLSNELTSKTKMVSGPIMADLNKLAHKEDPTRPTVVAASGDTINNEVEMVSGMDLIADNDYPGWYFGTPEDMGKDIEKYDATYFDRGLAISEYGGGGKIGDHAQGYLVTQTNPNNAYGNFQPEEWEAVVHEGNYAAIKKHPYVWGSFVWLAFDSGGLPRADGSIKGGNIKGLVTQDRKVRKDAYYFYQANWAAKPMAYLTSRRDVNRTTPDTPVKVYANVAEVTLKVNGKSYGTQKPTDMHVFQWKKITLDPGVNKVEIDGPGGVHDEAVWNLNAAGK